MNDKNDAVTTSPSDGGQGGNGKPPFKKKGWFQHIRDDMHANSLVGAAGITFTALFLIVLTVMLLYSITIRWPVCDLPEESQNANLSATQGENANAAANANYNANANAGAAKIDADSIEPTSGPVSGKTLVTIKGKNFGSTTEGMVVKFGEREANVTNVGSDSISVRTPEHSEGVVDVVVERDGERDELTSAYTYTCPAPTGISLFLMLNMAGALGGCIHAMRSLYWYAGQRELKWNWLPMYFALPFIGSAMATIFSLLIVAGFVDSAAGRSQSLFIIAVAGLVGMFSQQAALKLTDIANAFFTKPGAGSDAIPQRSVPVGEREPTTLTATAMDKSTGQGGDEVTIRGNGFSNLTTVSFGGLTASVKTTTVSPTSITVVAPAHAAGEVDVEVISGNQSRKLPTKFTYT